MAAKKLVGTVRHFYPNISVAVVEVASAIKKGDKILIEGKATSIEQAADSMQLNFEAVDAAKKGQSIGLKVSDVVKSGDKVYKA